MANESTKKPLQVLLTPRERAEIQAAAEKAGLALGSYMRLKALEAARA